MRNKLHVERLVGQPPKASIKAMFYRLSNPTEALNVINAIRKGKIKQRGIG